MRAVDTNVVVRYLTADEPAQAARARSVFDAGDIFISTTVLLESEWVLRSVYEFSAEEIAAAICALAGLPAVWVENPVALAEALDRVENGLDFADALHLAAAAHCEALLTFDRHFIAMAADAPVQVMEP